MDCFFNQIKLSGILILSLLTVGCTSLKPAAITKNGSLGSYKFFSSLQQID
jgi:hypothetical protein